MQTHDVYALGLPWNDDPDDNIIIAAKSREALKKYINWQNSIHNRIVLSDLDKHIGPIRVIIPSPDQKDYKNFVNLLRKEDDENENT